MTALPDCEQTRDLERQFGELLSKTEPPKKPSPDATPVAQWPAKEGREL